MIITKTFLLLILFYSIVNVFYCQLEYLNSIWVTSSNGIVCDEYNAFLINTCVHTFKL